MKRGDGFVLLYLTTDAGVCDCDVEGAVRL